MLLAKTNILLFLFVAGMLLIQSCVYNNFGYRTNVQRAHYGWVINAKMNSGRYWWESDRGVYYPSVSVSLYPGGMNANQSSVYKANNSEWSCRLVSFEILDSLNFPIHVWKNPDSERVSSKSSIALMSNDDVDAALKRKPERLALSKNVDSLDVAVYVEYQKFGESNSDVRRYLLTLRSFSNWGFELYVEPPRN